VGGTFQFRGAVGGLEIATGKSLTPAGSKTCPTRGGRLYSAEGGKNRPPKTGKRGRGYRSAINPTKGKPALRRRYSCLQGALRHGEHGTGFNHEIYKTPERERSETWNL